MELIYQTPTSWYTMAASQLETLLIDHAHCERKAASSAMTLINRWGHRNQQFAQQLSVFVREEMLHFEQVLRLIDAKGWTFTVLKAPAYMRRLSTVLNDQEPQRFLDALLFAAILEARSCERFKGLECVIDDREISGLYRRLHHAEQRHFLNYIQWAEHFFGHDITQSRWVTLTQHEASILDRDEDIFRFHSAMPMHAEPAAIRS